MWKEALLMAALWISTCFGDMALLMAASRVMGTGVPQWLAMRRGNARGAKVPTVCQPLKRKHCHHAKGG